MRKVFLFFVCCLFINSINCVGAEALQKESGSQAGIVSGGNQNVSKTSTDSIEELSLNDNVKDEMNSKRLEQAMQKKEREKSKKIKPEKEKKSLLHIALMYIPNRVIDLTDIVTVELGFGPEASCELTFTEYCQFGAAYGDRYFLEKGYNRQYGGGYHSGYNASFIYWNDEMAFNDYTFGTVEPYVIMEGDIRSPDKKPYSDGIRDFWKIGFHVGWIVDIGAAIHPVAIANFFTGFFFIRLTDTEEL
jgi:hypothetical protein